MFALKRLSPSALGTHLFQQFLITPGSEASEWRVRSISDISLNTQLYHVSALDVVMDGKGVLQITPLLSPEFCHIPKVILKLL